MKTIWKYPLQPLDRQALAMPHGAEILRLQLQDGRPCIWALVDDTFEDTATRTFATYGTGQELPENPGTYIGTYETIRLGLVLHVFEEKP
jgi:hypothetical protein